MTGLFGLGAFQTLVCSVLLFTKKERKKADRFLGGFFLVATIYFLYLYSTRYYLCIIYPDIIFIITLVPLLLGPLLFFYVKSLIGFEISKKQILPHLIPVVGTYLIILPFFFRSHAEKTRYFSEKYMNCPINIQIGTFLQHLSAPIYFIAILMVLKKHRQYLKNNLSTTDRLNLHWMRILLIGTITILMMDTIYVSVVNFSALPYSFNISWTIKLSFAFFIILIGFYGIKQGSVFTSIPEQYVKGNKNRPNGPISKPIAKGEGEKVLQKLRRHMEAERPYLDPELRIQDISVSLEIPVHIVSYVINDLQKQNFYQFVNSYRIKEAKARLVKPGSGQFNVLAIAYECGFNSKSTFNRLFKQFAGITTTDYQKKVLGL